ncbi:MAG TPA: ABC transporter substrate-binding protein [Actinomycetota bacterium]|nr:ABC transporter substrate-binding protein [Actinomycetota bacterium]
MRKILAIVAVAGLLLAACAEDEPTIGGATGATGETGETATGPTAAATAAECAADAELLNAGTLTIGTDNPAYPPYFAGGETKENPDWKFNDPNTGEGFEAAVAYEVAARLGFAEDAVEWTVAPFNQTYAPGAKNWDFAIVQISYSAKRDNAVDFSDSYYDVNQALVSVKGNPITKATSIEDLKDYAIATQIGTTSYDFIVETIQPNVEPGAYNSVADSVAALNAGQIDAIVVDLPTALYLADPFVQEVKNGVVVGQFETAAAGEYFGMTFVEGNTLRDCVNLALEEMKADGTLEAIQTEWLSEKTNVGEVPVLS